MLDCDNVLWGGILSEDGFENIKLSSSGLGKPYQDFQRYLLMLHNHGVIPTVCSKNDESGEIQYNDNNAKWKRSVFEFENFEDFEDCKRCKCLPICVGSCKRERIEGCAKPCLWREEDIYEAMQNYYFHHHFV